jgi:hypothetical protein
VQDSLRLSRSNLLKSPVSAGCIGLGHKRILLKLNVLGSRQLSVVVSIRMRLKSLWISNLCTFNLVR